MKDLSSRPVIEPCALQWKQGFLATRPPGKSHISILNSLWIPSVLHKLLAYLLPMLNISSVSLYHFLNLIQLNWIFKLTLYGAFYNSRLDILRAVKERHKKTRKDKKCGTAIIWKGCRLFFFFLHNYSMVARYKVNIQKLIANKENLKLETFAHYSKKLNTEI